jgi:Flp pilus assembly pilin Flp
MRPARYASGVDAIEAALIGGFVGAVIVSAIQVLLAWRQARHNASESQKQRAHELELRILEQHQHAEQLALEDAARLRDARFVRLNEDAKELARALFDLERLALLMQWGQSADRAEMDRVELSARARFESARAGLTLDPDGVRLTALFESLTRDIAQYQSMSHSHRVLVDARAVEQVVEHTEQMEMQRAKVIEGITVAIRETQSLLESVLVPIQAPAAPAPQDRLASSEAAGPQVAPSTELAMGRQP